MASGQLVKTVGWMPEAKSFWENKENFENKIL
jgi:hypothetical protein